MNEAYEKLTEFQKLAKMGLESNSRKTARLCLDTIASTDIQGPKGYQTVYTVLKEKYEIGRFLYALPYKVYQRTYTSREEAIKSFTAEVCDEKRGLREGGGQQGIDYEILTDNLYETCCPEGTFTLAQKNKTALRIRLFSTAFLSYFSDFPLMQFKLTYEEAKLAQQYFDNIQNDEGDQTDGTND